VETNEVLKLSTNELGRYFAPNLPSGTYRVVATKEGFRTARLEGIQIQPQVSVRGDFRLEVGNVLESVQVTGQATLLDASTATVSTGVSTKYIDELPLIQIGNHRTILNAMQYLPGVTRNETTITTWRNVPNFRLNGSAIGATQVYFDGAPGGVVGPTGSIGEGSPAVEAVGELEIVTNAFNAEYGRTGTWFTNVVFRSGTNQLHAKVFDFFDSSVMNARSFFQNIVPVMHQNEGGAYIGGPVYIPKIYDGRNRTFFYYGQQLFYNLQGADGTPLTLPTQAFRNGDFSQFVDGTGAQIPIFDPNTTRPDGNGSFIRDPFPGNRIPASQLSSPSQKILALMPQPDLPNAQINNFYSRTAANPKLNNFVETIKIDQTITDKQKLAFSYFDQYFPTIITCIGYGVSNPLESCQNPKSIHTRTPRVNYDYIIRPNLLNHFTIGADRYNNIYANATVGQGWNDKLGIRGLPFDIGSVPWVRFSGGTASPAVISNQYNGLVPTGRYSVNENLAWVRGRHSLKFGATWGREYQNAKAYNNGNGVYIFNNQTTSQPNAGGNFTRWGSSFASFLLGAPYTASTSSPLQTSVNLTYSAVFAQDEWRATPRLTVSYGLRWEFNPPVYEKYDRVSAFDATIPNPAAGGRLGALAFAGEGAGRTGFRSFADGWYKGVAPRLGLAYQLTPKTVVRASGGIYYSPSVSVNSLPSYGYQAAPTFTSPDGFTPVFYWGTQSFPSFPLPPFINPSFQNDQSITSISRASMMRAPQVLSWTFSIQRQLTADTVIDLTYLGSHSTHLSTSSNDLVTNSNVVNPQYLSLGSLLTQPINSPAAVAAGIQSPFPGFQNQFNNSVAQALKPYPQYVNITELWAPRYFARFNSLQVKVTKRYSSGLSLLAHYTWLKNLTNDDDGPVGGGSNMAGIYQNPLNPAGEVSVSSDGRPHTFVASGSYDLPFGQGKRFLNKSRALGYVVGGWGIAGFWTVASGNPLSVIVGNNLTALGYPGKRADYVGGSPVHMVTSSGSFDWTKDRFLNPAAFTTPPSYGFGNTARVLDWSRGWTYKSESLSLRKEMKVLEKYTMLARLEAQNPFNFHRWGDPITNLSDANFGRVTTVAPGRTLQVYLGLEF
jgi:hypothetical protein